MTNADDNGGCREPSSPPPTTTGTVLPFRPRTSAPAGGSGPATPKDANSGDADDFRHRMLINAAGLACAIILTASGIWLASSIANLRNTQDCVLSGRRNCAPIAGVEGVSAASRQH